MTAAAANDVKMISLPNMHRCKALKYFLGDYIQAVEAATVKDEEESTEKQANLGAY